MPDLATVLPQRQFWQGLFCGLLALAALAALLRRRREFAGTTLAPAGYWTTGSLMAIGLAAAIVSISSSQIPQDFHASRILYAASVTGFCPLMAVLGAKRPQDRAWQFIVLALLVVLLLPCGESVIYHPHSRFRLHPAWGWFSFILILSGCLNWLGTRYWLSALAWTAGQSLLLADQLPPTSLYLKHGFPFAGFALMAAAVIAWGWQWPRCKRVYGWQCVWLDFRDSFGALWALRVAERFNAAATTSGWSLRLQWQGFIAVDPTAGLPSPRGADNSTELSEAAITSMHGLLRRFVSPDWIEQRLDCEKN